MDLWYVIMVVLGIVSTILWLYLLGRPNRFCLFSPLGIFFFSWMFFIQLPALYTYPASIKNLPNSATFALGIPISSLIVLATVAMISGRQGDRWRQWWLGPTYETGLDNIVKVAMWAVALGLVAVAFISLGLNSPLVQMIRNPGAALRLREARREYAMSGVFRYLTEYRDRYFLNVAVVATAAVVWIRRRGYGRLVLLTLVAFFVLSISLARIRPARLMAALLIGYLLIRRPKIRLRHVVIGGFFILLFPAIVRMFRHETRFEWAAVPQVYSDLLARVFLVPSICLAGNFALVPHHTGGFLHGRTIELYAYLTQQPAYPLAYSVAYYALGGQYLGSSMANAAYSGAAWADFGWIGVVTYSVVLGLWLGAFDTMARTTLKTPITMALIVAVEVTMVDLVSAPLTGWLVGFGGIFVLVAMLALRAVLRNQPITLLEETRWVGYPAVS